MTTVEALPIARQMAAGLDAAHAAGVVHRDFKSANVILVPQLRFRRTPTHRQVRRASADHRFRSGAGCKAALADRSSADVTLADVIVGSPAYMAPEQVRTSEVSSEADIYAFGVVLYETVTGGLPFEGDVAVDALQRLASGSRTSPARRRSGSAMGAGDPALPRARPGQTLRERQRGGSGARRNRGVSESTCCQLVSLEPFGALARHDGLRRHGAHVGRRLDRPLWPACSRTHHGRKRGRGDWWLRGGRWFCGQWRQRK